MATIASTRTRAGLRVEAELDSGSYPVGLAVTREQFRALPVRAHAQHGEWNYTIAPTGPAGSVPLAFNERAEAQARALALLSDERLTGMSTEELARLADLLAPDQAAQAAQRGHEQRGGRRRRAPGAGSRGLLTDADRVVVTVVYLRQACSQYVLADLLGINPNSIGLAISETRQLLTEHGRTITPAALRFSTAEQLTRFASGSEDLPTRSRLPDLLADPVLTGMSRADLAAMTARVGQIQAAPVASRKASAASRPGSPPTRRRCWTRDRRHRPAAGAAARERSQTGIPFSSACSFDRRSSTPDMIEQATLIYRNGRTRPSTFNRPAICSGEYFLARSASTMPRSRRLACSFAGFGRDARNRPARARSSLGNDPVRRRCGAAPATPSTATDQ